MPPMGFERVFPANERLQTHTFDRAVNGSGWPCEMHLYFHKIGPTDLSHPSPASHLICINRFNEPSSVTGSQVIMWSCFWKRKLEPVPPPALYQNSSYFHWYTFIWRKLSLWYRARIVPKNFCLLYPLYLSNVNIDKEMQVSIQSR